MRTATPDRLDPVGRLRLPRHRTILRMVIVAALLLTAAGVLYGREDAPRSGGDGDTAVTGADISGAGPGGVPGSASDTGSGAAPGGPAGAGAPGAAPDAALGTGPGVAASGGVPGAGGSQPPRLPVPAGMVGVPVSLADPASLALLWPGDRVTLLAVPVDGDPAPVATAATVVALDQGAAALLLALTPAQGQLVTAAPAGTRFAVLVLP